MTETSSLEDVVTGGFSDTQAVDYGNGIYGSRGVANAYLITTPEGNVLINTGTDFEADNYKARFDQVSTAPIRYILFTQSHPDHVGGWTWFNQPETQTIAQANYYDVREYWRTLGPFYRKRMMKLWGKFTPIDGRRNLPDAVPTRTFLDSDSFEIGGRRFELYSVPGGETTDSMVVWLPDTKTVFIGNLLGPMLGHMPNQYTIRGDKIRSARTCAKSIDRVLDLDPETLFNGHFVFRDKAEFRGLLTKVRDATLYIRDRTVEGMNAGKDLWTIMGEVKLPSELAMPQLHGKVSWNVRAVWEELVGYFRYESTTELYHVPPAAVWHDIVELAGLPALVERAGDYAKARKPLHALQITDIVLDAEPTHQQALQIEIEALTDLLENGGMENFSEQQWLKMEIEDAQSKLSS